MTGFGTLLGKELREAWRTRRLPVVAILFLVVGIISPLTARYMNEILEAALAGQLPMTLPDPTVATAIEQLQKNLGQLGALAAIALAMGSVSGELDKGTAALVLAQPATRSAFLLAKLVALAVVLLVATAVGVVVAWAYTAILFEPASIAGWLAFALLAWLALLAWASVTFLASTVTGSTTAAAGLGFVALIVLSLLAVVPALDHVLPTGLALPASLLAAGRAGEVDGANLATTVAGTIVLVVACAAVAVASFRRREL
jgi:ABC-2 type transport system permease protein